jgi:hypothetical protein
LKKGLKMRSEVQKARADLLESIKQMRHGQAALRRQCAGDQRIEVRVRYGAEPLDQCIERRGGRQSVGQQSDRRMAASEAGAKNTRADDRHEQKRSADGFGREATPQRVTRAAAEPCVR